MIDPTQATQTKAGYAVKNIAWNTVAKAYLGMVADPEWASEKRPFVTCQWDKKGKCKNHLRPDCDLAL